MELLQDDAALLAAPVPDLLEELLPAEVVAGLLLLAQLALDDRLGRDAGVVRARDPERARPSSRARRTRMSWSVLFRTWPIVRTPVTLGGGITIE